MNRSGNIFAAFVTVVLLLFVISQTGEPLPVEEPTETITLSVTMTATSTPTETLAPTITLTPTVTITLTPTVTNTPEDPTPTREFCETCAEEVE